MSGLWSGEWTQTKGGILIPKRPIVKVFADECKGSYQDFQFWTFIWGSEEGHRKYEAFVRDMTQDRSLFQPNFSSFRTLRSRLRGNAPLLLRKLLDGFMGFVKRGDLSLLVYLESNEKFQRNANYFFKRIETEILNPETDMGRIFAKLPEEAKEVIAHQMKPVFYLLFLRQIFGGEGVAFDFHPDHSSNYFAYRDKKYQINDLEVAGSLDVRSLTSSLARTYLNSLERAGEKFPDAFRESGFLRNTNQDIRSYYPLADEECFTIQTADVICNLLAASFAVELGDTNSKSIIKREIVRNVLPFEPEILSAVEEMEIIQGLNNGNALRLRAKPELRSMLVATIHPLPAELAQSISKIIKPH